MSKQSEQFKPIDYLHQAYDFLSKDLEKYKDGKQFNIDLSRGDVSLVVDGIATFSSRSEKLNTKDAGMERKFMSLIEDVNPALEIAMKTMLHQAGPLFSASCVINNLLFPKTGMVYQVGNNYKRSHIIHVENGEVFVTEIVAYKALNILPVENASNIDLSTPVGKCNELLTQRQKEVLEMRRTFVLKMFFIDETASFNQTFYTLDLKDPFFISVKYKLSYCPEQKNYELVKPSENDVIVGTPDKCIEDLLFKNFSEPDGMIARFAQLIKDIIAILDKFFNVTEFSGNTPPSASVTRQPLCPRARM
ncbi:MAG: hypothetical protein V4700_02255 [Pseudomonadota bacterium]